MRPGRLTYRSRSSAMLHVGHIVITRVVQALLSETRTQALRPDIPPHLKKSAATVNDSYKCKTFRLMPTAILTRSTRRPIIMPGLSKWRRNICRDNTETLRQYLVEHIKASKSQISKGDPKCYTSRATTLH